MNDEAEKPLAGTPTPKPLAGTPAPKPGIATIPANRRVQFSDRDAGDLVSLIHRAPLQNMKEAQAVAQLLQRFQQWFLQQPRSVTPEAPLAPTDEGKPAEGPVSD